MTRPLPDTSPISSGGRVDFRLESSDGGSAVYDARWFVGDELEICGKVSVSERLDSQEMPGRASFQVEIQSDSPLPDFLQVFSTTLLRTTARGAPPWPRRITRWRDER